MALEREERVIEFILLANLILGIKPKKHGLTGVSSFLQKIDALRWTPHLDECLEVLNEKHESPIDDILVQQVRMQLIVEKVTRGPWNDGAIKTAEHSNVPLCFYLNALQSQLQEVKSKIPPYLKDNEIVLAHFYSTQLTINETVLSSLPSSNNQADFQPVERLYACIESVKSWFEIFFTIPPIAYVGFPFSIFSQLVRCLSTLYRLSTLEDPAWERKSVQKTADLLVIFDQVIKNMEQVAAIAGQDNNGSIGEDTFSRTAKMFRSIRPGWEAKLGGLDSETVSTLPTLPVGTDIPLPEVTLTEPMDKDWLMDLFLPPNYQFQ
ncbi:MAG: hypothetical protein L6R35_004724 [Caloplaca aegaea]|nr:MAG: hypothetical protein L6R35_004724 [Caloplaca aegaea]